MRPDQGERGASRARRSRLLRINPGHWLWLTPTLLLAAWLTTLLPFWHLVDPGLLCGGRAVRTPEQAREFVQRVMVNYLRWPIDLEQPPVPQQIREASLADPRWRVQHIPRADVAGGVWWVEFTGENRRLVAVFGFTACRTTEDVAYSYYEQ